MKVSMAEVNKKANLIINQVAESGEVAIILKHGKPIAEIRPVSCDDSKKKALAYLANIKPIKVRKPVAQVIEAGRNRGV
jgi:antitoxin (DNA-binding transcriptional repressor) of toxin-antitoxin stability system